MRTPTRPLILIALALPALTGCNSDTTVATPDDLCRAVYASVRDGDRPAFDALLLDDAAIADIAPGMSEETSKQRGIKEELLEFDTAEVAAEAGRVFEEIRAQADTDGLDLAQGDYRGHVLTNERFDVPGAACRTYEFELRFDARHYVVGLDVVQSPRGIHVFEAGFRAFDTVDVSFVGLEGDTVQAPAGEEFDYEVAFDADAVNAQGAWLEFLYDGKRAGMLAGTTLESPNRGDLPGAVLTPGTHTLVCRVQPCGQPTEFPLGEATLTIEVPGAE